MKKLKQINEDRFTGGQHPVWKLLFNPWNSSKKMASSDNSMAGSDRYHGFELHYTDIQRRLTYLISEII